MKKLFLLLFITLTNAVYLAASEKEIYIPHDLQEMNLNSDTSKWSFHRMAQSENIVVFWERGFGADLSKAPDLEGHDMKVNLPHLLQRLESFYTFYRDSLQFIHTTSKANHYKMLVMINYSLEGTAYGGDYDGVIGALWVAPNRIQDDKLNCLAHELGHSFQSQISNDGEGGKAQFGGFFEMTSQWMLWQVNPMWMTDENYHWSAFIDRTYKKLFDQDNIYHSPYVLEYWGWKHGKNIIAELYRKSQEGDDPAMTYKRVLGLSQEQFNAEMFDCYRRLVNYDMPRIRSVAKPYAGNFHVVSRDLGNYGFNVEQLAVPDAGKTLEIKFRGQLNASNRTLANWIYGFVGQQQDGQIVYGPFSQGVKGSLSFKTPSDKPLSHLWLVVMAAPKKYVNGEETYPYVFR